MSKRSHAVAAAAIGIFLAGCAEDGATTRNLDSLLADGPDAATRAKLDGELGDILEAQGASIDRFEGTASAAGHVVGFDTMVTHAMVRNVEIGRAAQGINVAEAERMRAVYAMLPQVSMNFTTDSVLQRVVETDNAVFERGEADYPVLTQSASIVQPLFDPARRYRLHLAKNVKSVAEVEYIGAVRDTIFEVYDNYIVANQSKARMSSLAERRYLVNRQIGSESALVDTGLSNVLQSSSLRSERDSIAADEAIEAARYAEALANLSQLTGLVLTDIAQIRFPAQLLKSGTVPVEEAVAAALENNPGIMSAALTVVGSEIARKEALASDISPVLQAYATIEREDRDNSRFGGGSVTVDRTLGLSLSVPIFNSRGTGLTEPTRKAELRAATLDYHARRRVVETEVRTSHARLSELAQAIRQSQNAAYNASRALEVEQSRVASGESIDLAVAARQMRLSESREQIGFYQAEYMRAYARLRYLMGADLTRQGF